MKLHKSFLLFVLVTINVSFIYAAKKQTAPEWLLDKELVYPYREYISEVGTGKTDGEAKTDALKNIGMFFETNVASQISTESEFNSANDNTATSKKMISTSTVRSNVKLMAVEYSEVYFDKVKKEYKVLAFINRMKAYDLFEPEILAAKNKFHAYTDLAQKALDEESDTIEAHRQYEKAKDSAEFYLTNLMFGKLISKNSVEKFSDDERLIANLDTLSSDCITNSKVFVTVENDYNGTILTAISGEFKKAGFTVVSDQNKANFFAAVEVMDNMEKQKLDEDVIYSFYPELSLDLNSKNKQKYSYHIKLGKVSAFDTAVGKKKASNGLVAKVKEELSEDLVKVMLN